MPAEPSHFHDVDLSAVPDALMGAVVAIGNFDGMHRGHQVVLENARAAAEATGRPAIALTFEPHPRDVFGSGPPVFRLTPRPAKARVAAALGLDGMVTVPFVPQVYRLPAEAFVEEILVGRLGIAGASIGWNFHFGAGRSGNPAVLAAAGHRHGFAVTIADPFACENGEPVSSSRIRSLLGRGEIGEAAGLLGYRWFFEGEVVGGDRRGRTIGYPTANIHLPAPVQLAHGIYAVVVEFGGERRHGVASWGRRPTFDNGAPVFETFVFDFSGDLYGETLTVTPVSRLRDEMKFDSVDALVARMDRDSEEARAVLSALVPVSPLDARLIRN